MLKERSKKHWKIGKTVVYLQKISCASAKIARENKKTETYGRDKQQTIARGHPIF